LRAIRFAAKLDFQLDAELVAAIDEQRDRLQAVPPARLFDELIKMFLGGHAEATLRLLVEYDLLQMLFVMSDQQLKAGDEQFYAFLLQALKNTDARVQDDKPVTPAFLYAAMLWGPVSKLALQLQADGMSPVQSLQEAGRQILHEQVRQIAIPKRFRLPIREIWTGQARMNNRRGRRASWLIAQPRFRAIYDFLLLRQQAGEAELDELSEWWTRYQEADNHKRKAMCQELQQKRQGNRPRKKK
jgi:poly(A) polymerase